MAFVTPQPFALRPNEKVVYCDYDCSTILERKYKLPKTKYDNLYSTELRVCKKYFNTHNQFVSDSKMHDPPHEYMMFKTKYGLTITLSKNFIEVYSPNGIEGSIKIPDQCQT